MIEEEYTIAAAYRQNVKLHLHNGEVITGKAELSGDLHKAKIRTFDGVTWIPFGDIEKIQRLILLH